MQIKALVIETAYPGDVVISLALAHALKQCNSEAHITYLVRPDAVELTQCSPHVDEVISFDKRGLESGLAGLIRKSEELNTKGFTHVFVLQNSRRNLALVKRLTVPHKVGFGEESSVYTSCVPESAEGVQRSLRVITLLTSLLVRPNLELEGVLAPPRHEQTEAYVQRNTWTVALAPGSAWPTKQWGLSKFAEIARLLVTSGVGVVLIGSRLEQQIVAYIPSDARHAVLDLTGQTTLTEAAGAIAACDLLVGNDSAPIHLASGVGTPSLAVFGPTIREFGFVPRNAEIIALDRLWCRPCSPHGDRVCPVYTHECMGRIDAATVHHRVQELLKLRSSAEAIGA